VMGEKARALLEPLRRHRHVGDVRGRGLLMGVELVADAATRAPFPRARRAAETVADAALQAGLVLYPGTGCADGTAGDLLLVAPPFVVSEGELAEMAAVLDRVLTTFDP
jgi:adenosylmethionine-8-amino-7-oxononanoate aminotransferase